MLLEPNSYPVWKVRRAEEKVASEIQEMMDEKLTSLKHSHQEARAQP